MSKTDSLHYKLCQEGAKWLKKLPFAGYKYIAVEIVCVSADNPDVWGTNGSDSTMIEVKVSRSDFLNDKRKFSRQPQNVIHAIGNYRYYLCPKGIINSEDLPESWGLLWYDNGEITSVKEATYIKTYNRGELSILSSIMRREGVRNGIFNYQKNNGKKYERIKKHNKSKEMKKILLICAILALTVGCTTKKVPYATFKREYKENRFTKQFQQADSIFKEQYNLGN